MTADNDNPKRKYQLYEDYKDLLPEYTAVSALIDKIFSTAYHKANAKVEQELQALKDAGANLEDYRLIEQSYMDGMFFIVNKWIVHKDDPRYLEMEKTGYWTDGAKKIEEGQ